MSPAARWASAFGALALINLHCHRNTTPGDTISECTRAAFRTDTPLGKTVFTVALVVAAVGYHKHITKG